MKKFIFISLMIIFVIGSFFIVSAQSVIDSEIYKQFNQNKTWVRVVVYLKNSTPQEVFFPEIHTKFISSIREFAGINDLIVTKEGLSKLINDPRVESVYYILSVKNDPTLWIINESCSDRYCLSEAYVKYDLHIQEKFNQNQTWVRVGLDLNNVSESNNFLSSLSGKEFKTISTAQGTISGEISKEGFNKVINDPRIVAIYSGETVAISMINDLIIINSAITESESDNVTLNMTKNKSIIKSESVLKKESKNNRLTIIVATLLTFLLVYFMFKQHKKSKNKRGKERKYNKK